jgi:hypothetical protein
VLDVEVEIEVKGRLELVEVEIIETVVVPG